MLLGRVRANDLRIQSVALLALEAQTAPDRTTATRCKQTVAGSASTQSECLLLAETGFTLRSP